VAHSGYISLGFFGKPRNPAVGLSVIQGVRMLLYVARGSLLLAVALLLSAAATGAPQKKAKTPPPRVQLGLVQRVAIMPERDATGAQIKQLQPVADAVNAASRLYLAWVYNSGNCKWDKCNVSDADIIIRTALDGDGVRLASTDMHSGQPLSTLLVKSPTALSSVKADDVRPLLGTPSLTADGVSIMPQYLQYVLIVPQTANDAPYTALVQHLLARQGLPSFPSQYTYATLDGAQDVTAICSRGERYFVYTVNTSSEKKKWIGFTRVDANANGFLADCMTHRAYRFAGESTRSVPTSSETFTGFAQILKLAVFPHFDWGDIGSATTAVASFADVDPTAANVQYPVIMTSLQKSVDLMCAVLSHAPELQIRRQANAPTNASVTAEHASRQRPTGVGNVETFAESLQAGNPQSTSTSSSGSSAGGTPPQGEGFGMGALVGPSPFPLACSGPLINVPPAPRPQNSGVLGSFIPEDQ
jgi:hypothetical protein